MLLAEANPAHTDARGSISDLVIEDEIGAVAHITFTENAVRGNHIHNHTTQWNYVVAGHLEVVIVDAAGVRRSNALRRGGLLRIDPGEAHALRAEEPTELMVFTMGPRAGKEYESDTIRLAEPLISSRD